MDGWLSDEMLLSMFTKLASAASAQPPAMTRASSSSATASSVRMPPIVYGTAWKKERTRELVLQALQAGYRGIDTACQPKHYAETGTSYTDS